MSHSWLPGVLAEIAEVAGLEAALAIADKRGGTKIYIPAHPSGDHWLVQTCGLAAAKKICTHFTSGRGNIEIDLPLGPRGSLAKTRARVDEMIASGATALQIALAVGYTTRGVRKRKAKMRAADKDQGRLF